MLLAGPEGDACETRKAKESPLMARVCRGPGTGRTVRPRHPADIGGEGCGGVHSGAFLVLSRRLAPEAASKNDRRLT